MPGIRRNRTLCARRLAARCKLRMLLIYYMLQLQMVTREIWIHPLNEDQARKGEFFNLYCDQRYFGDKFFENYRMSVAQFDELLRKITPLIKKKDTNFRKAITPEEKLLITLRCVHNSTYYYRKLQYKIKVLNIYLVLVSRTRAIICRMNMKQDILFEGDP